MAISIKFSFQINPKPTPFSIMALTMMMNHFAGTILLMICNTKGMLEIGKINPESKMVGNMSPINEIIIAVCCDAEMVEIKMPNASDVMMNKTLSNPNKIKLP